MPMYVWHCNQCSETTEIFNSIHESDNKPERCSNVNCISNSTSNSTTMDSEPVIITWTKQLQPQINRWRYCD